MSASNSSIPSSIAQRTERWFQRAAAALLGQVPCRAGCSRCCVGPFPITLLDVRALRDGLDRLPSDHRAHIERRAREQTKAIEAAYPRLAQSPYLDRWLDADIDRLVSDFHQSPCPALDEGGLCELYDHRPLTCRSMGIPTEQAGITSGACEEVQTFIPLVRLSAPLRTEEHELAQQEAQALEACRLSEGAEGEEVLLPYGFLPAERPGGAQDGASPHGSAGWTGDKTLC